MGTWGQGKGRARLRPTGTQAQEGEDSGCPEGAGVLCHDARQNGSRGRRVKPTRVREGLDRGKRDERAVSPCGHGGAREGLRQGNSHQSPGSKGVASRGPGHSLSS